MGYHIGIVHSLIREVFVRRVDVPRGGCIMRESGPIINVVDRDRGRWWMNQNANDISL